jgi:hypothetical protein
MNKKENKKIRNDKFIYTDMSGITIIKKADVEKERQEQEYSNSLKHLIMKIEESRAQIFDAAVALMMAGELREWSEGVLKGETHEFSVEMFLASDDVNIKSTGELLELMQRKKDSLMKTNNTDFNIDDLPWEGGTWYNQL